MQGSTDTCRRESLMNHKTALHKDTQGTRLCIVLIPLFDTVAPDDMQRSTEIHWPAVRQPYKNHPVFNVHFNLHGWIICIIGS